MAYVAPAPLGGSIDAFTRSLLLGLQLRGQQDDAEVRNALLGLQGQKMMREAEQEQQMRAALPQILSAQPQTTTMAPATPATLQWGQEEGAGVQGITPGQPAITQQHLSMSGLTQQIGAPAMAAVLGSPEGRAALDLKGVKRDEDIQKLQERARAMQTFNNDQQEAFALGLQGDAVQMALKQAAAWNRVAPYSDNPTVAFGHAEQAQQRYLSLHGDQQERQFANEDAAAITKARKAYRQNATPETFDDVIAAYDGAKSKIYRTEGAKLNEQIAKNMADEVKFAPFNQFVAIAAQIREQAAQNNQYMDWPTAYQKAAEKAPQIAANVRGYIYSTGKQLPSTMAKAFGEKEVAKDLFELAVQAGEADANTKMLPENSDERRIHLANFVQEYLRKNKEMDARDREMERLQTQYRIYQTNYENAERRLERAIRDTASGGEASPETARVRTEMQRWQDLMAGLQQQLEKTKGVPGPAPSPAPALPVAKKVPQKDMATQKPMTPDLPAYKTQAMAELQRLVSAGHTKASAIQAMQKQGWQVQ